MLVLLLLPLTLSIMVPLDPKDLSRDLSSDLKDPTTMILLDPRDQQCDSDGIQCRGGCCPEYGWGCCKYNLDYCAPTEADCPPCPTECSSSSCCSTLDCYDFDCL